MPLDLLAGSLWIEFELDLAEQVREFQLQAECAQLWRLRNAASHWRC
jgi:hypothetical protein